MAITKYKLQTKTYKALLTQTGDYYATDISGLNWTFIVGETYTIVNYLPGDDFSNIANVISGTANTTDCVFVATGKVPTDWTNGSSITSSGGLVVDELENNLGFTVQWLYNPSIFGPGIYAAIDTEGPISNTFPSEKTHILVQSKRALSTYSAGEVSLLSGVANLGVILDEPYAEMSIDDALYIAVYDTYEGVFVGGVDNNLDHVAVSIEIYP